tara:strand:+ start:406 stop:567 length:162 start_codon:yes stop_codon:yes gene_type:complete
MDIAGLGPKGNDAGWRAVALNDVVDAARRGGGEAAAAQQLPRACVSQTGAPWR